MCGVAVSRRAEHWQARPAVDAHYWPAVDAQESCLMMLYAIFHAVHCWFSALPVRLPNDAQCSIPETHFCCFGPTDLKRQYHWHTMAWLLPVWRPRALDTANQCPCMISTWLLVCLMTHLNILTSTTAPRCGLRHEAVAPYRGRCAWAECTVAHSTTSS